MTYKEKVNSYLKTLNVKPDHEITRAELKTNYLSLIKEHPVDTDSKGYYEIKDAYDYLYDHIDMVNETLQEPDVVEEVIETKEIPAREPEETFVIPPVSDVKVKDRPTLIAVLLSLVSPFIGFIMFIMLRKVTPKSSWLYLGLAILSILISAFILFMLPSLV